MVTVIFTEFANNFWFDQFGKLVACQSLFTVRQLSKATVPMCTGPTEKSTSEWKALSGPITNSRHRPGSVNVMDGNKTASGGRRPDLCAAGRINLAPARRRA
ncbi:hypothetical protein EVAR_102144_1 [Eumeta japonica]|uniref:Uncharacterized protein n=1 Tax=Eumeta variegata TaxID=151549 RepID=A0A4C1U186_EUMVA|nr:hypothetical protein EVAR_102144_1 [Eumeta japonica]